MRLLLAEDESAMAEALTDILTYHRYQVDVVDNGEDALHYAQTKLFDGIILDVMMPHMDGLTALKKLRAAGVRTPVLLLTARAEVEDRIAGLDLGADDYLPKPFVMGELLARLRAMLRRRDVFVPDLIQVGRTTLDPSQYTLRCGELSTTLGNTEYRLLELFMRNPGVVFSTERLLERIWGWDSRADAGSVWVYISYLRKRLAAVNADVALQSRRSVGYSLEVRAS